MRDVVVKLRRRESEVACRSANIRCLLMRGREGRVMGVGPRFGGFDCGGSFGGVLWREVRWA